jgi:hypothetical protein
VVVVFIDLLVAHGADEDVTVAAVDRLADLFPATYVGRWEWPLGEIQSWRISGYRRIRAVRSWPSWLVPAVGTTASATACWPPHAPPVIVTSALPCLLHSLRRVALYVGQNSGRRSPA